MEIKMYRCDRCGALLDENELDSYKEAVGEYHGQPAYQEFICCPCGCADVDEVKVIKCDECGEEINGKYYEWDEKQVCPECLEKYKQVQPHGERCDVCDCIAPIGYRIMGQWHCLECIGLFEDEV